MACKQIGDLNNAASFLRKSERSSVVELHLAKVNVEGSNPFARSSFMLRPAHCGSFFALHWRGEARTFLGSSCIYPCVAMCKNAPMEKIFGLYLIATDPLVGYESLARAAVECKVRYLQLRMKNVPSDVVLETARLYREITKNTETRFIVNDDLSIAMEVDADGVHLGQDDQSIAAARAIWNVPGKLIGLSTHTMAQALSAQSLHPDYIGIGPVYPTATKPDAAPALGAAEVGCIAQAVSRPSVVIGGITLQNLPDLLKAGASNYCVVGAVNRDPDPVSAIRALQALWDAHCVRG